PAATASRPSLTDAFADLGRPDATVAVASGAVDVRRVTPVRLAPATATKPAAKAPAKPAHPSRIWVQVATGRDKSALGFDWRRMIREDAAVFRGKSAYVSAWGQTNRLLTGPFETQAAANAYIAQLRRADVDGAFLWTSPAGQVVDALSVK
ncbi:MAG: SPOR domain-containing protein, partial [Xanthobacteraceae bacterium]